MSKKEITICDGCGKELKRKSDIYHLYLKTDKFWNGVEKSENVIRLDFCYECAVNIKETLEKIARKKER